MKSILDPSFRYTPSGQTDVRKTFARVRRELHAREQAQSISRDTSDNVLPAGKKSGPNGPASMPERQTY